MKLRRGRSVMFPEEDPYVMTQSIQFGADISTPCLAKRMKQCTQSDSAELCPLNRALTYMLGRSKRRNVSD